MDRVASKIVWPFPCPSMACSIPRGSPRNEAPPASHTPPATRYSQPEAYWNKAVPSGPMPWTIPARSASKTAPCLRRAGVPCTELGSSWLQSNAPEVNDQASNELPLVLVDDEINHAPFFIQNRGRSHQGAPGAAFPLRCAVHDRFFAPGVYADKFHALTRHGPEAIDVPSAAGRGSRLWRNAGVP